MAISTIGVGGDFASPSLWEASLPAALTEDEIARILDDLSSLTDVDKTFDINVQTSVSAKIIIETWDSNSNAARVQDYKAGNGDIPVITFGRGGTFGVVTLRNGADHVTVRGVTTEITAASSNLIRDTRTQAAADSFLDVSYCYSYATTGDGGYVGTTHYTKGVLHNCLLVTNNTNGLTTSINMEYYNNTVVYKIIPNDNSRAGIRNNILPTRRNAVFGYGPLNGYRCYLNNSPTFEDNASSDETGNIGFQNLSLFDQYTDPANHDWSFKAGNSLEGAAIGGENIGINLPTLTTITGTLAASLNDNTSDYIATLGNNISGTLSRILVDNILLASGSVGNSIEGNLSETLEDVILGSVATLGNSILGNLDSGTFNVILNANSQIGSNVAGNLGKLLDDVILSANGTIGSATSGVLNKTIQNITLNALANVGSSISGNLGITLGDVLAGYVGRVGQDIYGDLSEKLDDNIINGVGQIGVTINATLNKVLENVILESFATSGNVINGNLNKTSEQVVSSIQSLLGRSILGNADVILSDNIAEIIATQGRAVNGNLNIAASNVRLTGNAVHGQITGTLNITSDDNILVALAFIGSLVAHPDDISLKWIIESNDINLKSNYHKMDFDINLRGKL